MNLEKIMKIFKKIKKTSKPNKYKNCFYKIFSCAVCLIEFEPNSECRETICWHIFHKDCLDSWLMKHEVLYLNLNFIFLKNCPYCRSSLSVRDLKDSVLHPKQFPRK